ncbi:Type IV pilus biogenesis protein PilE [Actinokineospora spheciospongiae]|uniref:Type IV pilus biogenesis protein PilE n=1 Tax=Actinokineospora spheciospongiae TaxID=909613 RepID=W7IF01_9PSEU|nr:hypothetical protein [Actinokineospora spheciospongiae]EWC59450.1 Type IV pilus biogenesis protein PilE [Actinokineospora spheciospongiae]PWW65976.1 hypothetical protein DFQ13_102738 [Actinokineospora spheciospongiae]
MAEQWSGQVGAGGQYFPGGMVGPPPKRPTGLWVGLSLLLVVLLGAVAWLVVATNGTPQRRSAPDDSLTKVVTASDGRSRMTVPEGWRELAAEYRDERAVLAQGQLFQERYVMVVPFDKADYTDFPDFEEATVSELAGGGVLKVDQGTPMRLGGRTAVRYEMSGSIDGVDALFWQTLVEGDGAYYQVIAWTLEDRRDAAGPALDEIVATFEEIGR